MKTDAGVGLLIFSKKRLESDTNSQEQKKSERQNEYETEKADNESRQSYQTDKIAIEKTRV
jgi:hypothetical protein